VTEFCECGCGKALPPRERIKGKFRGPKRRYFNSTCRYRAWKAGKVLVDKADLDTVVSELEKHVR